MIKYIKLINGEELVSQIEETDIDVRLIVPAILTQEFISSAEPPKVIVLPYIPHVKDMTCSIQKKHILFMGEVNGPLKEYYETNINVKIGE